LRTRVGHRDKSLRGGLDRWALLARLRLDIQARLRPPPGDPDPIPLRLRSRPDLITEQYVGLTLAPAADNPISVAFAAADQALLIVGRCGAGKSHLLVELAEALLAKAEAKTYARIPVLVHLASWSPDLTLADWLSVAIDLRYQTGLERARTWIDADLLLPLLDGLDETSDPGACVAAINGHRAEYPEACLAVASRLADYQRRGTRLDLGGAVEVLPLPRRRIDAYLHQASTRVPQLMGMWGSAGGILAGQGLAVGLKAANVWAYV
jgi:hypothetical protein